MLSGSVGPGFNISLRDAAGAVVSNPAPGPYAIEVDDKSDEHNFHLYGPGVDVSTTVEAIEQKSFQVTLADGVYRFICDAHPTRMRGQLHRRRRRPERRRHRRQAGTGGTITKPLRACRLDARPHERARFVVTLKTKAGKRVTRLKPGRYTILVRDRSSAHNAHLLGAGVNRKTSVAGTATQTWKVVLKKGTLVFQCDAAQGVDARHGQGRRRSGEAPASRSLRATRPSTSQTGPWVSTLCVSAEHARDRRRAPGSPRSSSRSKQRRAIAGETP